MAEKQLKPGWKVWRFDQIATNVNERVDNPSESGMEHHVGLEHLDSDSLHPAIGERVDETVVIQGQRIRLATVCSVAAIRHAERAPPRCSADRLPARACHRPSAESSANAVQRSH